VEAAQEQQRHPEIVVSNRTPSVDKLLEEYPADQCGYALRVLAAGEHSLVV
jgi:hypothetical protein